MIARAVRRCVAGWLVGVLGAASFAACTPSASEELAAARPDGAPTSPSDGLVDPGSPSPSPTSSRTSPAGSACGSGGGGSDSASKVSYAGRVPARSAPVQPWRERPVVRLCFDVPANRQTVVGSETVIFTPDRRTCEVVFRTWPNKPETARVGNRLVVDQVAVDGRSARSTTEAAGGLPGEEGTLLRIPVLGCLDAGEPVTVDLAFTLTLGADTPERVGYSTGDLTAWLGTAYPLLAWERGRGWATDPAVELYGETVTSEEFRLASLEVVAPHEDAVLGTGRVTGTAAGPRPGTVVHRFAAESVRDVTVTVGRLAVVERVVDGVRMHVGGPRTGTRTPLAEWADETAAAVRELSAYFGALPYDDLWITIAPDIPSGIEFPGAIQFGDVNPATFPQLVPHEVAHMWFYGLVGNDQARDPWLDEAFAEYAEVLVNGTAAGHLTYAAPERVRFRVGETMSWYDRLGIPGLYSAGVYRQGGAMLHRARQAAGPQRWDRLLRAYLDANAHRIVTDDDVVEAFTSAPEAVRVLREYGALTP